MLLLIQGWGSHWFTTVLVPWGLFAADLSMAPLWDHSKSSLCVNSRSIQSQSATGSNVSSLGLVQSEKGPWKTISYNEAGWIFLFFVLLLLLIILLLLLLLLLSFHSLSLWWLGVHGREHLYNLWKNVHLEKCIWFVAKKLPFSKL